MAMAKDRRTEWRWMPPECLAELKALEDEDDELTQPPTKKQSILRAERNETFPHPMIVIEVRPCWQGC